LPICTALNFAAHVAKSELAKTRHSAGRRRSTFGVLGTTVPQQSAFHGFAMVHGHDRRR